MLLGLHSGQACGVLAKSHEAPDLVAKLGQSAVVSRCQASVFAQVRQSPDNIVIRYICPCQYRENIQPYNIKMYLDTIYMQPSREQEIAKGGTDHVGCTVTNATGCPGKACSSSRRLERGVGRGFHLRSHLEGFRIVGSSYLWHRAFG